MIEPDDIVCKCINIYFNDTEEKKDKVILPYNNILSLYTLQFNNIQFSLILFYEKALKKFLSIILKYQILSHFFVTK